ncbi:MAG: hypothetical protein R2771_08660 [Saprospiraceae bacterium]
MNRLYILLAIVFPSFIYAQSVEDALRFSRTENFSTARSMGVAGAFGAMGADFGTIGYNPATLGNYWRGEMVFSLDFKIQILILHLTAQLTQEKNKILILITLVS